MPELLGAGHFMHGRALAWQGEVEAGIEEMRHGLGFFGSGDTGGERPNLLALLGEWCGKAGRVEEGLQLLDRGADLVVQPAFLPEVERIRGELLLLRPDIPHEVSVREAEACFQKSIKIARSLQIPWRELIPTISLTRLLMEEDRRDEARELLSPLYNWFTEGFDTGPMREAKQLLDELAMD